tara:strand:- start:7957 stop:8388 length:432 start_codon:yes stop_codon:yes gene_type:complete
MQHVILAIVLFFSSVTLSFAQESNVNLTGKTITVSVTNALSDKGEVHFAIFTKENFRKESLSSKSSTISNGKSSVIFENISEGAYAVVCYHDENNNGTMDFQENGMPKESYGTSNNALSYGPPQFESAKFEVVNEDLNLEIKF